MGIGAAFSGTTSGGMQSSLAPNDLFQLTSVIGPPELQQCSPAREIVQRLTARVAPPRSASGCFRPCPQRRKLIKRKTTHEDEVYGRSGLPVRARLGCHSELCRRQSDGPSRQPDDRRERHPWPERYE